MPVTAAFYYYIDNIGVIIEGISEPVTGYGIIFVWLVVIG